MPTLLASMSRPIPGRRVLWGMLVVFLLAVVPAVVGPTLMCRSAAPTLDDLGTVPRFQLTDERGQAFTDDALRGHVTIVSFLFTRCDTICPVTTMKMARLQDKTFDVRDRVKLASFSVDPAYDTPAVLAAYADKFHADATRWRFVTGPAEVVRPLIEGAFMSSMAVDGRSPGGAPQIAHSGHFLLVDGAGHLRGAYDSGDIQRLDELIRDARFLARTGPR